MIENKHPLFLTHLMTTFFISESFNLATLHVKICSSVQQYLHALVHCTAILEHDGTVERRHSVLLREGIDVHTAVVQEIFQALIVTILCSNMKSVETLKRRGIDLLSCVETVLAI